MSAKPQYGFNMLWMFSNRGGPPEEPNLRELDFIAGEGFDFIRIPTDYTFSIKNFEYDKPDERVFEIIDRYVLSCRERGLNAHRAPGYCINDNDRERDNLWADSVAQDAFCAMWRCFAERYRGVPSDALSFDLLNEPPKPSQYGFTREIHEQVMRRAVAGIRAVDPDRLTVLDGICGGGTAIPELAETRGRRTAGAAMSLLSSAIMGRAGAASTNGPYRSIRARCSAKPGVARRWSSFTSRGPRLRQRA